MNLFKKRKKNKPDERVRILRAISEGLILGEQNKDIKHMKKVIALATSGEYEKQFSPTIKLEKDNIAFLKLMQVSQERFELKQKKLFEEIKNRNNFWYKTKKTIHAKLTLFSEKMEEIWSFIKHEFLTIRKLIFFINDLFFGKKYKNRKLFYEYKNQLIESNGYIKGERRFNSIVSNITKGAELNKRILKIHG